MLKQCYLNFVYKKLLQKTSKQKSVVFRVSYRATENPPLQTLGLGPRNARAILFRAMFKVGSNKFMFSFQVQVPKSHQRVTR